MELHGDSTRMGEASTSGVIFGTIGLVGRPKRLVVPWSEAGYGYTVRLQGNYRDKQKHGEALGTCRVRGNLARVHLA